MLTPLGGVFVAWQAIFPISESRRGKRFRFSIYYSAFRSLMILVRLF